MNRPAAARVGRAVAAAFLVAVACTTLGLVVHDRFAVEDEPPPPITIVKLDEGGTVDSVEVWGD